VRASTTKAMAYLGLQKGLYRYWEEGHTPGGGVNLWVCPIPRPLRVEFLLNQVDFMKNFGPKPQNPPSQLSAEAKAWWRKIIAEWDLDVAGLLILGSAMECLDRMREAQEIIQKEGITVTDRFGQEKQHPATLVERDSKAGLLRHLTALHLDIEPLNSRPGRPAGS
jgi:P27 family predicted phage terminase small subunit